MGFPLLMPFWTINTFNDSLFDFTRRNVECRKKNHASPHIHNTILLLFCAIVNFWDTKYQTESKKSFNMSGEKISLLCTRPTTNAFWPYAEKIFAKRTLVKWRKRHTQNIHIYKIWSSLLTFCMYATRVQKEIIKMELKYKIDRPQTTEQPHHAYHALHSLSIARLCVFVSICNVLYVCFYSHFNLFVYCNGLFFSLIRSFSISESV